MNSGKLPTFRNNLSVNKQQRTRYDVIGDMRVAFSCHLVDVTYFVTSVGAKFDENRGTITPVVSNSFYT